MVFYWCCGMQYDDLMYVTRLVLENSSVYHLLCHPNMRKYFCFSWCTYLCGILGVLILTRLM